MVVNDRHYALLVGINAYPGVTPLNGPVNDAHDVRDWLTDPGGGAVPPGNVRLVVSDPADGRPPRPVQDEIEDALIDLNAQAGQEIGDSLAEFARSRLLIYVAGHGIMPGDGDGALLLANARKGAYSRNIELRAYTDWYVHAGLYAQVVVYADCCRNWFPQARGTPPTMDDPGRPNGPVDYLIWYATGPAQSAYEDADASLPPDQRRGYFTRALLDGLREKGLARPDGTITAQSLLGFVRSRVDATVPGNAESGRQRVTVVGTLTDPAHDIVLSSSATTAKIATVTIHFPAGFAAAVELELPDGTRRAADAGAGPWTLELPVGRYGVVLAGTEDAGPFAGEGLFRVDGADRDVHL
jgi:uncharacterized caspase-like protein